MDWLKKRKKNSPRKSRIYRPVPTLGVIGGIWL